MRAPISPPVNLKVENCYVIINLPLSVREKKDYSWILWATLIQT